jgi:glyoxylase-like metal-dependent hydrolase (beta-lactamase superfamily II)
MRVRWLGWAGIEVEDEGARLLVDPLDDPTATFAALGEAARAGEVPVIAQPDSRGTAVAGLVTHLHRDHTDAAALAQALRPDATVYEPAPRRRRTSAWLRPKPSSRAPAWSAARSNPGSASRPARSRVRRCPPSTGWAILRCPG